MKLQLALAAALLWVAGCAGPGAGTTPSTPPGGTPTAIDNGVQGTAPANGKTLLAVYMIGSDLEDDIDPRNKVPDEQDHGGTVTTGNGTADLREMLAGYEAMSQAERDNVSLLVGFGGARKQGWQGITYADQPTLQADAADGYFGNGSGYLYHDAGKDMGAQDTFADFLKAVKTRSAGMGKVMVVLWDHGGAYVGVGPDRNSGAELAIASMRGALKAVDLHPDLIGFDACLMDSLEVASAVRGFGKYLVASEEEEPSHGWNYTALLKDLGQRPQASAVEIGRRLVDSYEDSPEHQGSQNRSLALVDLDATTGVSQALDAVTQAIAADFKAGYQPMLNALSGTQRFGVALTQGKDAVTVDVGDLARRLRDAGLTLPPLQTLQDAQRKAVIYARQSGTLPGATGLAVFSPTNGAFLLQGYYGGMDAASKLYLDFVNNIQTLGQDDAEAPKIAGETPAAGGWQLSVTDNVGVQEVLLAHGLQQDADNVTVVATDVLEPTALGQYSEATWDGQGTYLGDGSGKTILMPTSTERALPHGELYTSPARLNGNDVMVFLAWDDVTGKASSAWAVSLPKEGEKDLVASKDQIQLKAGDQLSFYQLTFSISKAEGTLAPGPAITLGGAPAWSRAAVDGKKVQFVSAADLHGNATLGAVHAL